MIDWGWFVNTIASILVPTVIYLLKIYIDSSKANKIAEERHSEEKKKLESQLEEKYTKENKLLASGICLLIRINLIDSHKKYMAKGKIPLYALDNVKTLYSVYSMFGENGVHTLMEELGNLPIDND